VCEDNRIATEGLTFAAQPCVPDRTLGPSCTMYGEIQRKGSVIHDGIPNLYS
jgi:hypothetical protein